MARFATKASWQRHRATQCYREIAERTRKAPLPGPEKSLLRYRGKASAELAPLTCYADLEVYSTPAPTVHIAQQQPARQTVAASSCYVAVGRDSDKYHAVRATLDDLLKLADHYLSWRRRTRPVSMTRREELEHRAATHCRECLASFETAEKKLHHCHGTGQYLGALRHSCNIAAQTPKTIPAVFHNGGGYDFHFLLRYIATMGSPVSRAPREELGEDRDDEGSESEAEGSEPERPMPHVALRGGAREGQRVRQQVRHGDRLSLEGRGPNLHAVQVQRARRLLHHPGDRASEGSEVQLGDSPRSPGAPCSRRPARACRGRCR